MFFLFMDSIFVFPAHQGFSVNHIHYEIFKYKFSRIFRASALWVLANESTYTNLHGEGTTYITEHRTYILMDIPTTRLNRPPAGLSEKYLNLNLAVTSYNEKCKFYTSHKKNCTEIT